MITLSGVLLQIWVTVQMFLLSSLKFLDQLHQFPHLQMGPHQKLHRFNGAACGEDLPVSDPTVSLLTCQVTLGMAQPPHRPQQGTQPSSAELGCFGPSASA